jgi:hypothetical protein
VSGAQPPDGRVSAWPDGAASGSLPHGGGVGGPGGLVTLPLAAETLPSCALDAEGMREQGARYAELGRHVAGSDRELQSLIVRFDATVEGQLLRETVEVERGCCSFFGIDLDGRTLHMTVADPAHDPALDAIAGALGV